MRMTIQNKVVYIFLFILGTILGSFSSLVISRTINGESIIYPPSHCDYCSHRLHPLDLFPIFSFIFLKGKCRYCKTKIPIEIFFTETVVGILMILIYNPNSIGQTILLSFSIILALIIAVIDFKSCDIYMYQVLVLAIIGAIYRYLYLSYDFEFFKKILIFFIIYWLIYKLSRGGIGNGDIYFYISLFLFLPNELIIWLILYSLWIGAIFAILIAIKYRSTKIEIPFCIYIFIAFILVIAKNGVLL